MVIRGLSITMGSRRVVKTARPERAVSFLTLCLTWLTVRFRARRLYLSLYADGIYMIVPVDSSSPLTLYNASFRGAISSWASL